MRNELNVLNKNSKNFKFKFSEKITRVSSEALDKTREIREKIRKTSFLNQKKILEAFISENVGEHHFSGTTGYGFNDAGRQTLDRVYARIFNTEAGLVRHFFVSGTHAIASVLLGNLRPGDKVVCATGDPYDTLKPVLGIDGKTDGSLAEWGISTVVVSLDENQTPDLKRIAEAVDEKTKMIFIQRSCGYTWRRSFPVKSIAKIIQVAKERKKDVITLVDNCYGEMVEEIEPTDVGADVMAGSLIKNMGAGIAPTGGFAVGRKDVINSTSAALTSAGIGSEEGATLSLNLQLFQGTFNAPRVVAEALAGAVWAAYLLESFGLEVMPRWFEPRTDIIQGIKLGSEKKQKIFCRGIQRACPVDHRATPIPAKLPGYRDPIIMAGGTFIQGSSIELSCDGPLRQPHAVYLQGGLSFAHVQLGVMNALQEMIDEGLL